MSNETLVLLDDTAQELAQKNGPARLKLLQLTRSRSKRYILQVGKTDASPKAIHRDELSSQETPYPKNVHYVNNIIPNQLDIADEVIQGEDIVPKRVGRNTNSGYNSGNSHSYVDSQEDKATWRLLITGDRGLLTDLAPHTAYKVQVRLTSFVSFFEITFF